jgi:hypothetical protein
MDWGNRGRKSRYTNKAEDCGVAKSGELLVVVGGLLSYYVQAT